MHLLRFAGAFLGSWATNGPWQHMICTMLVSTRSYAMPTDVQHQCRRLRRLCGLCRRILWAVEAAMELSRASGFCDSAGLDADAAVVQWQGQSIYQSNFPKTMLIHV